jgi:uncharacterized protein (TIGR02722 family)
MQKKIGFWILFICGLALTSGCASSSVARLETEQTVDLSTRWNDTDSRETAKEMIKEALDRPWVDKFQSKYGKEPIVIVGAVLNKSHDHVPTETFTKDLERELTNSGRVTFVASKAEREEVRQERLEQQTNSSEETTKRLSQETGADYMLKGVINSFEEEANNKSAFSQTGKESYKYFQVTLEMIDMENNTKVWYGDKKIKKLMTRKRFGF